MKKNTHGPMVQVENSMESLDLRLQGWLSSCVSFGFWLSSWRFIGSDHWQYYDWNAASLCPKKHICLYETVAKLYNSI